MVSWGIWIIVGNAASEAIDPRTAAAISYLVAALLAVGYVLMVGASLTITPYDVISSTIYKVQMFYYYVVNSPIMGAAISAFGKAIGTTITNPIIIIATAIMGTVGILLTLVLSFIPILGPYIGTAIATTLMAGVLGMAAYGSQFGSPKISHYVDTITKRGWSVFIAIVLEQFLFGVVGTAGGIVFLFTLGIGEALTTGQNLPAEETFGSLEPLVLAFMGLFILVVVVLWTVFQFIDVAVVLGGKSSLGVFPWVFKLTAYNPLSVIGYTILRVLYLLVSVLILFGIVYVGYQLSETLGIVILVVLGVTALPLILAILYAYHAEYYIQLTGIDSTPSEN